MLKGLTSSNLRCTLLRREQRRYRSNDPQDNTDELLDAGENAAHDQPIPPVALAHSSARRLQTVNTTFRVNLMLWRGL